MPRIKKSIFNLFHENKERSDAGSVRVLKLKTTLELKKKSNSVGDRTAEKFLTRAVMTVWLLVVNLLIRPSEGRFCFARGKRPDCCLRFLTRQNFNFLFTCLLRHVHVPGKRDTFYQNRTTRRSLPKSLIGINRAKKLTFLRTVIAQVGHRFRESGNVPK